MMMEVMMTMMWPRKKKNGDRYNLFEDVKKFKEGCILGMTQN